MIRKVSVAPMMDCTDRHDRYFLRLISKNVMLYTDMIVSEAIKRGDKKKLLSFNLREKPLALQIGGSSPKILAEATKIGEDFGYDEINLNLGCPSKKVQKNKFGACLMKEPNLVGECINEMKNSCTIPISAKTRIGYNEIEDYDFFKSFIEIIKKAGSNIFIIHARRAILEKLSPKQNLNVPPLNYNFVYDLKKDFYASYLWSHFLKNKPASYREQTSLVQFVVDYIAGMTDSFFIRTLEEMMIPKKIKW